MPTSGGDAPFRKTQYELSKCPICGSAEATEIADRSAIQQEVERVWAFHARRFRHPVPPDFLTDRVVFSQDPPLRLMRCVDCTHLYRSPREKTEAVQRVYSETARLLDGAGFTIRRIHGDTLFPIADRWTKSRGAMDELLTKRVQRIFQRGWRSPWVEVYARVQRN